MKNILVATDFSENAYNALLYATQLFKKEPCRFCLLHSFEPELSSSVSRIDIGRVEQVHDRLLASSKKKLLEVNRSIRLDCDDLFHHFENVSTFKPLVKEINFLIKEMTIDYVVMGSTGVTGLKELLFGSNTVGVIKQIKGAPLLIIPNEIDFQSIKKIAFLTSFKNKHLQVELNSILELAERNDACIEVAHIWEKDEQLSVEQDENARQLMKHLQGRRNNLSMLTMGASKTETILEFTALCKINLLALVYYKHSMLEGLFHEAVVKNIGRKLNIPYLVIPAQG